MLSLFLFTVVNAATAEQLAALLAGSKTSAVDAKSSAGSTSGGLPTPSGIDWTAVKQHPDWVEMEGKLKSSGPLLRRANEAKSKAEGDLKAKSDQYDTLAAKMAKAEDLYKKAMARLGAAEAQARDASDALVAVYQAQKGGGDLKAFVAAHPLAKKVADAVEGVAGKTPADLLADAKGNTTKAWQTLEAQLVKLGNKDAVSAMLGKNAVQMYVRGVMTSGEADKIGAVQAYLEGENGAAIDAVAQPYVDYLAALDEQKRAQAAVDSSATASGAVAEVLPADFTALS